jgi:preprotein translocase subunit SecA
MAQRDPMVEHQREGYDMFVGMLEGVKEESVGFLFNVQVEAVPQTAPTVAPVATPQGLADLGAPEEEPSGRHAATALRAKGIEDEDSRQLTYSGPAEDGSAEVKRNGGGRHAAPPGASRKERREAARRQAKEEKTLRRG